MPWSFDATVENAREGSFGWIRKQLKMAGNSYLRSAELQTILNSAAISGRRKSRNSRKMSLRNPRRQSWKNVWPRFVSSKSWLSNDFKIYSSRSEIPPRRDSLSFKFRHANESGRPKVVFISHWSPSNLSTPWKLRTPTERNGHGAG